MQQIVHFPQRKLALKKASKFNWMSIGRSKVSPIWLFFRRSAVSYRFLRQTFPPPLTHLLTQSTFLNMSQDLSLLSSFVVFPVARFCEVWAIIVSRSLLQRSKVLFLHVNYCFVFNQSRYCRYVYSMVKLVIDCAV